MDKSTELVFLLLLITLIGGFYIVLSDIHEVKNEVAALQTQISAMTDNSANLEPRTNDQTTTTRDTEEVSKDIEGTAIPTSILFKRQSSPLLSPQTELTISIERFVKSNDGTLTLHIKVFSDKAESYSALQPGNLFEIVNLGGENQKSLQVNGSFDAIPPQGAVEGTITFKTDPSIQEVILRVHTNNDNVEHYRFNFDNQNYKKAILG